MSIVSDKWWETIPLHEMPPDKWEALCDGCGKCCLTKILYEDSSVKACKIGCKLLDIKTARCKNYKDRQLHVKNCHLVTLDNINDPGFLPDTCAYKLIKNKKPLYDWHYLISGNRKTIIEAGMSAVGFVEHNEDTIGVNQVYKYLDSAIDY